eukprot:5207501-Amphidinium_carterae.1
MTNMFCEASSFSFLDLLIRLWQMALVACAVATRELTAAEVEYCLMAKKSNIARHSERVASNLQPLGAITSAVLVAFGVLLGLLFALRPFVRTGGSARRTSSNPNLQ